MNGKGIKILAIAGLLIVAMVAATMPVEAKTLYFNGKHWVTRYDHADIPAGLNDHINYVEYDMKYYTGPNRYGVRLHLFDSAKYAINGPGGDNVAYMIAWFIRSREEWHGNRPQNSVKTEIKYHSLAALRDPSKINPTHVQYFCADLEFWEKPFYGC